MPFKLPKKKCVKTVKAKSAFDKRSFRWTKQKGVYALIGCPKGQWMPKARRCKVGTRAHELAFARKKNGSCPVRTRKA